MVSSERGQGIIEIALWVLAGVAVLGGGIMAVKYANGRGDKPLTAEQKAYVQSVATQQAFAYIAAVATQQAESAIVAPPPAAPGEQVAAPIAPSAPPPAPAPAKAPPPSAPVAPPPPPPTAPPAPPVAAPTTAPPPPPPPVPTLTRDDLIAYFGGNNGEANCIVDAMLFAYTLEEITKMGIAQTAKLIPADIAYCIQKFKPDGLPPPPLPTTDPTIGG